MKKSELYELYPEFNYERFLMAMIVIGAFYFFPLWALLLGE